MDALTLDHMLNTAPELQRVQAVSIHFRRDPRLTVGPDECAWCEIDGQRYEIPKSPKRIGTDGRRLGRRANGATVSRLIVKLAGAGYPTRAAIGAALDLGDATIDGRARKTADTAVTPP